MNPYMKEMERPHTLIEEDRQAAQGSPAARVEAMFEHIIAKLPGPPDFVLCVLPVRKNSDIYGKAFPVVEIPFLFDYSTDFFHALSRTLEEKMS